MMSRTLLVLALLASLATIILARRVETGVLQQEYTKGHDDFAKEVYDSSFLEMRNGVSVWQCCRVCPQNHLLEIDQLFGQTPPPPRKYDDAPTFLEEAARVATGDSNCCNVCPTGQAADRPQQPVFSVPEGGSRVRKQGIFAPLRNLKFSLSKVPLPPCCPYCREAHLDEAFNLVVPPVKMRGLPYLQRKDKYSGKKVFLELEAEIGVDADMEAEAESETQFMREYTYTPASPDNCCNRCLRAPTATEASVAAGENVWPVNEPRQPEEAADDAATAEVAQGEPEPEAAADEPAAAAEETPAAAE